MTSSTLHIARALRRLALSLATLLALLSPATASAESGPMLTQSWAMPNYYNPAAVGLSDYIRVRGAARLQWVGIENAPKSFIGTADSPFKLFGRRFGAGVTVTQESLGLFSNLLVTAQLATTLKVFKGDLSIGLQAGYYNSRFRGTEVVLPDQDDYHQGSDVAVPTQDLSGSAPDFSLGLWYRRKAWGVGISGQHLLQPTVKLNREGDTSSETHDFETELSRTLYLMADGNIELKNTLFTLQPSLMAYTDLSTFGANVALRATYNRLFTGGVGYRWNDAVSIMLGVEIKNFFLSYAYDIPVSSIGRATSGSHELVAGYRFKLDMSGKNKNRHRSIRLM